MQPHQIPELERIAGNRLPGQAMADLLMVFEFLHNFGETLGFGTYRFLRSLHMMEHLIQFFIIIFVFRYGISAHTSESPRCPS